MARKIEINGYGVWKCPVCGGNDFNFDGGSQGVEFGFNGSKEEYSNELLTYSCRCNHCGTILQQSYLFLGMLTIQEFNQISKEQIDETIYDVEREKELAEKRTNK